MNILRQTNKTNCGQTCVAMLLDISLEDAEKLIGHNGITTEYEVLSSLHGKYPASFTCDFLGPIKHRNRSIVKSRTYLCKHRNPSNENQEHWTICVDGKIIDPSGRDESRLWPMIKYWIIK